MGSKVIKILCFLQRPLPWRCGKDMAFRDPLPFNRKSPLIRGTSKVQGTFDPTFTALITVPPWLLRAMTSDQQQVGHFDFSVRIWQFLDRNTFSCVGTFFSGHASLASNADERLWKTVESHRRQRLKWLLDGGCSSASQVYLRLHPSHTLVLWPAQRCLQH